MIICLGWGSLINDPGALPVVDGWAADGPALPLEFARESRDGRMTLVVVDHDRPVPVLWAALAVGGIEEAHAALREREKATWDGAIGRWPVGRHRLPWSDVIGAWAGGRGVDGVVWTGLRPGMRADRAGKDYGTPSLDRIREHLVGLDPEARARAAHYVLSAPRQIETPYRADLERLLG